MILTGLVDLIPLEWRVEVLVLTDSVPLCGMTELCGQSLRKGKSLTSEE